MGEVSIESHSRIAHRRRRADHLNVKPRNLVGWADVNHRKIAHISVGCIFWPEDDGWTGVCENLSILVWGRNVSKAFAVAYIIERIED